MIGGYIEKCEKLGVRIYSMVSFQGDGDCGWCDHSILCHFDANVECKKSWSVIEYERNTHGQINSPNTAQCFKLLFDNISLYVNINCYDDLNFEDPFALQTSLLMLLYGWYAFTSIFFIPLLKPENQSWVQFIMINSWKRKIFSINFDQIGSRILHIETYQIIIFIT